LILVQTHPFYKEHMEIFPLFSSSVLGHITRIVLSEHVK
jgi:hypothetical protein